MAIFQQQAEALKKAASEGPATLYTHFCGLLNISKKQQGAPVQT